ncbi:MAG: metallophosphoesterase [Myxococcota bacterium]
MRIASVSDLHVDHRENREALVALASAVHEGKADLVIVAGDVSHLNEHITMVLKAFKVAAPEVAYLPGNHDLWFARKDAAEDPEADSWRRYREDLRKLVEAEECHYLPAGPFRRDAIAVVGETGWYDHSLLRPEVRARLDPVALSTGKVAGMQWMDERFAVFRDPEGVRMDPASVARVMEASLAAQLEGLEVDAEVEHVVVATHVLAFREALGAPRGFPWDAFDAFMGSEGLGEVIKKSKKVRAAIYGHTHRPGRFRVDSIEAYGTPLGYPRERKGVDPQVLPERAIGWFTL